MLSCVLIIPVDQLSTGNAVGEAMGWGPNNFTVPISIDGKQPVVTHFGLHVWADSSFEQLLVSSECPQRVIDAGITEEAYQALLEKLIYSFRPDSANHFDDVLAVNNLSNKYEETTVD